jgi:Zn-dependent metalloprotease
MHISRRTIIGGCLAAAAVLAPAAAQAAEPPRTDPWQRSVERQFDAAALGLADDAAPPRLARAAIARSQAPLGLRGSHGRLRLARSQQQDGVHRLTFQQTLGGLRVLWSEVDVAVARGGVRSISGTTVRVRGRALPDERRISARRARTVALRAVHGAAGAPQLVAFAGEPGAPREPRRAYVVQVSRAGQAGERSVVVDAATGTVLARRAGTVALPGRAARSAPTATASAATTLYQITNFAMQPGENNYAYGKTDRTVNTPGNPYSFGEDVDAFTTQYNGFTTALNPLSASVFSLGYYHCLVRDYCGRDGGNPGPGGNDYNRFFIVGNWTDDGDPNASQYQSGDEHIMIGKSDTNDRDVLAHEFGHLIDHHYRDDWVSTFEGETVQEALADMFFIDAMRTSIYNDSASSWDFASHTQTGLSGPHTMTQYSCTTNDEHTNASILAHAYWELAEQLGNGSYVDHERAGRILTYIPWALPAKRTFGSVRVAFKNSARALYGTQAEQAVNIAFDHVGVYDWTQHLHRCPPPPQEPAPICNKKPDLPQCQEATAARKD